MIRVVIERTKDRNDRLQYGLLAETPTYYARFGKA